MDNRAQDRDEYLVSVVIVTYQSASYISYCLESLSRSEGVDLEVIVVDNHSFDETLQIIKSRWPDILTIANDTNQGFAKACNIGAHQATGEFLVFLNPDCIIGEETIYTLVGQASKSDVGLVGPLLLDGSGNLLPESARNIPTSAAALTKVLKLPFSQVAPYYATIETDEVFAAPVLCGACMCTEKSKYKKVGGFDESYFMYGEDVDLSVRFLDAGFHNICESGTSIIHFKGESADKGSMVHHHHFYKALELYHKKHGSSSSSTQSFGVSLLSSGLARQRYLFFHLRKWISFITDAFLILCVLMLAQFVWSFIKSGIVDYYGYFKYLNRYILCTVIWMIILGLSGVYHEGPKRKRAFIGGLIGSGLVIGLYALLPIDLRFSRMITLLGAILVPLTLLAKYGRSRQGKAYAAMGHRESTSMSGYESLDVHQIANLAAHHEVVWDIGSFRFSDMISVIRTSNCSHRFYNPTDKSTWSSNDPHTEGSYMMSATSLNITSSIHQLQKRIWDVFIALMLIIISIFLPLLWRKNSFLKIRALLLGRMTLVGYDENMAVQLPETKPYLITCYHKEEEQQTQTQQALRYVTQYSIIDDVFLSLTSPHRIIASLL